MHFALMAGLGHLADVGPFSYPTFDGAVAALRGIAEATGPDDWVMGRPFDPTLLEPPLDLTTRELDAVAPDRSAFVLNASGHTAYVNGRALELGGITRPGGPTQPFRVPNPISSSSGRSVTRSNSVRTLFASKPYRRSPPGGSGVDSGSLNE